MERSNQGSQSNAAFSKSMESSFKDNSLFIDLGIPKARNVAEKCRHFSLRGYVADMRKRDRNMCLPFASDGNIGNMVDQLPELVVPKFRWWRCQNCLQEVGVASALEGTGEVPECGNTGLLSGSTCPPSPSDYSLAIRMSDERRKVDENTPANLSHENADIVAAEKIISANLCGNENHSSTYKNSEKEFSFSDAKVGNVLGDRKSNSEEASKTSKVITTGQLVRHSSLQLEDSADRLSVNDGMLTGDNEQSQQDYSSGRFPRRKTQKMRLLTELLDGNKNSENNQTEGSPSKLTTEVTSTSISLPVPQGKFSPCNSYKSHWSGRERRALGGNKRKQTQVDGEQLSLAPWQQAINKLNHARDASHDSFTDRGMEPSFRGVMPPQRRERKSVSSKNKNRMLQLEDAQLFARPKINRKDVDITGTDYEAGKVQLEPKICADALDLSLHSCIPLHRDERNYAEGGTLSFTPTQKGIVHGNIARKDGLFGELHVLHNSTPDQCSKEAILLNLNEKIAHRTAILREQRNYSPHPSNGIFSLHQNLDFSDPRNNEKNSRIREPPEARNLNTDQRAEVSAKGNSDDIPMEIVELLSKGKSEREWGLSQDKSSYYRPTSDNTRNENVNISPKANGNGVVPFVQINYPSTAMRNPLSNATIDMITAANVAPTNNDHLKFSDKARSLLNMGQVGNPPFSGFEAFSPSQPKALSDAQFSHSGFPSIGNLQNREQRHKLTAQLHSPTNMKIFKPFNCTHEQQTEAGSIWSFLAPNHMPVGHNIPQKFPNHSTNMGMDAQLTGRDKGKRTLNFDLNVVDLDGASIEEQTMRASGEFPFLTKNTGVEFNPKGTGPSNASHGKETMPAMHLLSLMDAGTQSSKPTGLNGKMFLSEPFSPCSNHPSFSGNEKPRFLEKPLFPKSGLMPGSGESSRHFSSALIRENLPGKLYEYPSAIPSIDSLFRNVEKPPGLTNQVLRTQELGKGKGSYSAAHVSRKCSNLGSLFMHEAVRPTKDWPCTDVCTVNRNPADFSVPEAGNEYMISCEDLKCRKKVFPWGESVLKDLNGKKKRRITKDHSSK